MNALACGVGQHLDLCDADLRAVNPVAARAASVLTPADMHQMTLDESIQREIEAAQQGKLFADC